MNWQRQLNPPAWAVVTGQVSGVVVLDFDGPKGVETMARLGLKPHVRTGGGGYHVYVRHPGFPVKTVSGKARQALGEQFPGLDCRADGGYAIAIGRNASGTYEWLRDLAADVAPSSLGELLGLDKPPEAKPVPANGNRPQPDGRVAADHLVGNALAEAPGTGRNNAGFRLALQLRDNGYSQSEALAVLRDFAEKAGAVNLHGTVEAYSEREIEASIRQAYSAPARDPWTAKQSVTIHEEQGKPPDLLKPDFHDAGNSDRLKLLFGDRLGYCHATGRWLCWDRKRWAEDSTGEVYRLAKQCALEFLRQAVQRGNEAATKFALQCFEERRINNCLASAESELFIVPDQLDAHPFLLNVRNGTLDLSTGKLRPHDPRDYLTKLVDLNYDSDYVAPVGFLRFIYRVMNGRSVLVKYVQRALGYSLTGDVIEKTVFLLVGAGSNGKTTLLELIRSIIPEYSASILIDTLMLHHARETNASLSDLAALRGARFVTTSETESGQTLAASKIKYVASGMGRIRAIPKYSNPIEFPNVSKLWIDCNHKPRVRDTELAIWQRLKVIPFDTLIGPDEMDKRLLEKLQKESASILSWLAEGCLEWQAEGLGEPSEVSCAVGKWRDESDPLRDFISDLCELDPKRFTKIPSLWKAYDSWCESNGEKHPLSRIAFNSQLESKGCRREPKTLKSETFRAWLGIGLRDGTI